MSERPLLPPDVAPDGASLPDPADLNGPPGGTAAGETGQSICNDDCPDDCADLVRQAARADEPAALAPLLAGIPEAAARGLARGADVFAVGRLVSTLYDAAVARVCALAVRDMGQPPGAFSLFVLGSEGRTEQYLATDQDNGLVWTAPGDGVAAAEWFAAFGRRVSAGLLAAGFPPCPQRVMADNPTWNRSLDGWKESIDRTVLRPGEDAVLRLSQLADLRCAAGDAEPAARLRSHLVRRAPQNPLLLRYMALEAVRFPPPLGFFGGIAPDHGPAGEEVVDAKRGGIFPITQGVRTLALAHAVPHTSTEERLKSLADNGHLSFALAQALHAALDTLHSLRLHIQLARLRAGAQPDNLIPLDALPPDARQRLKDAFHTVEDFQSFLSDAYGLHLMT